MGIHGAESFFVSQNSLNTLNLNLDKHPKISRFTLFWHNMAANDIYRTMIVYDRSKCKLYCDERRGYYKDAKMGKPRIKFEYSEIADWHIKSGAKDKLSFNELSRRLKTR